MGILVDALGILMGCLWGSPLQKGKGIGDYRTLGIAIMILSLVGFLENMYYVQGQSISSKNLTLVILSYILGSKAGEWMRLEERFSNWGKTGCASRNAFLDAALFFGVGGLQISGPIALAVHNDSTQLLIKSVIDFPFAVAFGAAYGKTAALSALPVAAVQLLIAGIAYMGSAWFTPDIIAQICAMGYIILFFSGYNLLSDAKCKIHNINMIPGILLILIFNIILNTAEKIL